MKRCLNILTAILILVGAFTASAQGQTSSTPRVIARIPFAFNVGKTKLPAGKYTFSAINPSSDRKILQIRSSDGRLSAMILTTNVIGLASDNAKLVFHRYDNRYFFARAQMAGDSISLAAVKSDLERAEKQTLARAGKKSVILIVLAEE